MTRQNPLNKPLVSLFYVGALAITMISAGLSGCASVSASNVYGNDFHYNHLSQIKVGMTRADVVSVLGKPDAVGVSPDGSPFFKYKLLNIHKGGTSVGLFVTYMDEGESRSGYICTINFSKATGLVTDYDYRVYGSSDKFLKGLEGTNGKGAK